MVLKNPILVLLLIGLLTIGTVSASQESKISQVSNFDFRAQDGMVIDSIIIGSEFGVPALTNQTIHLYSGSEVQTLTITSWKEAVFHWRFHITLDNGTASETKDLDMWSVQGTYRTTIQPVTATLGGINSNYINVNLYIGTRPLQAMLQDNPPVSTYTILAFDRVQGEISEGTTDIFVSQDTYADFQNIIQTQDPFGLVAGLAQQAAQAALNVALWLIGQIPFVGPFFILFLQMAVTLLTEGIFWLEYIFWNATGLGIGFEAVILMISGIEGNMNPGRTVKLVIRYNTAVVKFFLWGFQMLYELVMSALRVIGMIK